MKAAGRALAIASLTIVPIARDAFEAPHALVLALGVLLAGRVAIPRLAVVICGGLGGLAAVTTLTSVAPALSFPGLVTFAAVALFSCSAASLDWRGLVVASAPVCAWAVAQATGHDFMLWQDVASWCGGVRPFSTLGHPTQLGVFLAAVTILALEEARTRGRLFLVFALASAVICVATMSRAGWLSLLVGTLVYGACLGRSVLTRPRLAVAGLALMLAASLAVLLVGLAPVLERVTHVLVAPTRLALWQTALAGFAERPWLGFGFDAFVLVDQQYRQPIAWRFEWGTTANHAHASIANVLATQGLLGLLAHLAVVLLVARTWLRRRVWAVAPAETAIVLALALTSLVTFHAVLTSALLGVALVKTLAVGDERPSRRAQWLAVPVVGLLGLMVFVSCLSRDDARLPLAMRLEPWSPFWPALTARSLERAGKPVEALQAYEEGVRRAPALAVSHANVARVASRLGDRAKTNASLERALRLSPLDARIALMAAEANARLGELDLAAGTLERLLVRYPDDGPAWLALGRVRILQRRPAEARAMLEASLETDWRDWPDGLGVARDLLIVLFMESGDVEGALQLADRPHHAELPRDICGAPQQLR